MDVKKLGTRTYLLEDTYLGFQFRVKLRGGLFSTSAKAERAAGEVMQGSIRCLHAAELIDMIMGPKDADEKMPAPYVSEWRQAATVFRELATVMPSQINGFASPSGGMSERHFHIMKGIAAQTIVDLIARAPATFEDDAQFFKQWRDAAVVVKIPSSPFNTTSIWDLRANQFSRGLNLSPLVAKGKDAETQLRTLIMNHATRHMPQILKDEEPTPAQITGPQVVRGNRALTRINVMEPQIKAQLAQVSDPEERARLESRMETVNSPRPEETGLRVR